MRYKTILNYLGQMRIYSFLDLFVFATAVTRDINSIIGILFLWLSFLLYLESRHNDKLRLKINKYLWLAPFVFSIFLLPFWVCLGFAVVSYFYTSKKRGIFWGILAPIWRTSQNGIIAFAFNPQIAGLVFILIFTRNLIADFRDAGDDKQEKSKTIPVVVGININQAWAFYAHLFLVIFTTFVWFNYSFLNIYLIFPIIILQIIFYSITPRLSNPKYLNIYNP